MSSAIAFVADIDFSRLFFSSPTTSGGRKTVDLFADRARGAMPSNRVRFQAAADETKPLLAKYGLDAVRDTDHDPTRRKLLTVVHDDAAVKAFQALDEVIVAYATEHSREWFKKELSAEQVRARFKPTVERKEDDWTFKFAVKCTGNKVPTTILRLTDDDGYCASTEADLTRGSEVVPIVSTFGVWFTETQFGCAFQADKLLVRTKPPVEAVEEFRTSKVLVKRKREDDDEEEAKAAAEDEAKTAAALETGGGAE